MSAAAEPRILGRLLLLWAAAAVICCITLRFWFPGYFDPFAPFHSDHFIYIGMHAQGNGMERYLTDYPRPIAHVWIDLCGRLGVYGLLAPPFLLTWLNAALLVLFLERVIKPRVAWSCFVLFAALAYSNPEFYWNAKQDPFSTLAFAFLMCIFHAWQSYLETGGRSYLALTIALALLFSVSKESYYGVLLLFFLLQIYLQPARRQAALAMLSVSLLFMGFSLHRSMHSWVLLHGTSQATDPYYTSLNPRSVWHGFLKIGKYLAVPAVGIPVLAALIRAAQTDRRIFFTSLIAVFMAAASFIPNATLPNHLEASYAFLGSYFFLAPLLFADRLIPASRFWRIGLASAAVAVLGLALVEYRRPVREVAGWLRVQEQIARRMLPELERIRAKTKPGDGSLIAGTVMFYNPFLIQEFILSEFGPHRYWTVIVDEQVPEQERYTTRFIHASHARQWMPYNHLFTFAPDGRLASAVDEPDPESIERILGR